jgi:hypothetical protein
VAVFCANLQHHKKARQIFHHFYHKLRPFSDEETAFIHEKDLIFDFEIADEIRAVRTQFLTLQKDPQTS